VSNPLLLPPSKTPAKLTRDHSTISEYNFSHLLTRSGTHWDVPTTFGDAIKTSHPSDFYVFKGDPEKILDQMIDNVKTHFPSPDNGPTYSDSDSDDEDDISDMEDEDMEDA